MKTTTVLITFGVLIFSRDHILFTAHRVIAVSQCSYILSNLKQNSIGGICICKTHSVMFVHLTSSAQQSHYSLNFHCFVGLMNSLYCAIEIDLEYKCEINHVFSEKKCV